MSRCPSCYRRLAEGAACPRDKLIAPISGEPPPLAAPPAIPGYEVEGLLGGGGFALVWAARRHSDGSDVALKVGRAEGTGLVARFLLEGDLLRRVGARAGRAPRWIDDGLLPDGRPYIAMERVRGETLAQRLSTLDEPPAPAWIHGVAKAVLEALSALHALGFVHRDLKPENVMLAGPDRVVLLDYGLATPRGDAPVVLEWPKLTRTGVAVGTLEYMAPEQIRAEGAALAATDLYAFGVLLFELFTLTVPFTGERGSLEHAHLSRRPPRPSDRSPVPSAFEAVILACLAKDPARRPKSAAEALRSLDEAISAEESPASGAPASAAPTSSRGPASVPRLLGGGRHPAVIAVIERGGAASDVIAVVKAHRGHVVRQRGSRFVALFSAFDADRPAHAASAAARELVELGARAALHLDTLTIRRKEKGAPAAYGPSIERPEAWMPAEPWSGLFVSEELGRVALAERARAEASTDELPAASRRGAAMAAGSPLSDDDDDEAPLFGRGELTAAIEASVRAAFQRRSPRLVTLIGDAGVGKTRLLREAAARALEAHRDARVISVAAGALASRALDASAEGAALLLALVDATREAPVDPTAFWVDALGDELGRAAAPFLSALVGWRARTEGDGDVLVMRSIAAALKRRAAKGPLAVILDDAHRASDALLDALEYATLGGDPLPLCVVVAATPVFERVRRAWGGRTRDYDRLDVGALGPDAAMELAAELLKPAEYPPMDVLSRLASWSGGNPSCLREVARALKRAGIVRRRPSGGSHYVATANLDGLPPLPAWQWIAARALEGMPPELAACVRLCAVLGATFTQSEAEVVQDALDRAGEASTPLDMGFALASLVERRILQGAFGGEDVGALFAFRNAALQEAVYEMLEADQRTAVHRRAFELWRSPGGEGAGAFTLERVGRHAAAIGAKGEAAAAYIRLGDLARASHKDTEADRAYTIALNEAESGGFDGADRARARAHLGRGRSRYRVARVREAQADFESARALAEALGDARLRAETLLEEATALDWHRDYEASARSVSAARPLIEALAERDLDARLLAAEGRAENRRGKVALSISLLEQAASMAGSQGDDEARVVSLLLLAFGLAAEGRLDASEARFHEVISLALSKDDRPHLCAAYCNRMILWFNRREPLRAVEDLRRAIALARELGNPGLERAATYNVAVLLHWSAEWGEARALLDRVRLLEERFSERPSAGAALLSARVLMSLGELDEAAATLGWVRATCPPGGASLTGGLWSYGMVQLSLIALGGIHADPRESLPSWDEVLRGAAEDGLSESIVEALYWRARSAILEGRVDEARRTLDEARERRACCPIWTAQFEDLSRGLARAA